jgi:hypothetical protein
MNLRIADAPRLTLLHELNLTGMAEALEEQRGVPDVQVLSLALQHAAGAQIVLPRDSIAFLVEAVMVGEAVPPSLPRYQAAVAAGYLNLLESDSLLVCSGGDVWGPALASLRSQQLGLAGCRRHELLSGRTRMRAVLNCGRAAES